MEDIKKLYEKENLTQKDIIQLLLHNAQHMVTREEIREHTRDLKSELKEDIDKKFEILDKKINEVEKRLNERIETLDKKFTEKIEALDKKFTEKFEFLNKRIDKLEMKFDRLTWLIIATILTVLLKDQILKLLSTLF